MMFEDYLAESDIINYTHPEIADLAHVLSKDSSSKVDTAKRCFEFVRDQIHHSGDYQDSPTTLIASDVLKYKTGWCYAKSHLLAALLRANQIPTGFCYQRLSCSDYKKEVFCLHGLNAVYLEDMGWYRIDSRGNKPGIHAQFTPPIEKLAFKLQSHEQEIDGIFPAPLNEVVHALKTHQTYNDMIHNFPDIAPTKRLENH